MTTRSRKSAEVVSNTSTSIVATGVGIIAGPVVGAVVKSVLNEAGSALIRFVADRRARRANAFVAAFLESGTPDETGAALLRAELERAPDGVKDAVVAAVREMEEALCDDVVPALGLLTRGYASTGRGRDVFFIGTSRLLRDISSADELKALQDLLAFAVEDWPTRPDGTREPERGLRLLPFAKGHMLMCAERHRGIEWRAEFTRPLQLLVENHLLVDVRRDAAFDDDGSQFWRADLATLSRLVSILP